MLSTIFTISTIAAVASAASLGDHHTIDRRAYSKTYTHVGDPVYTTYTEPGYWSGGNYIPAVTWDKRTTTTKTATSQQHTNSYCPGYSAPALHHANCPAWGNWESSECFLNLFKECDSRSDCKGVNYKASPGDGFSLRAYNPVALSPGSTFEWCNVMVDYTETTSSVCSRPYGGTVIVKSC